MLGKHPRYNSWCQDLCGSFFMDWLFLCFLPSWEKRTVFHSSLQAENYFGQVFSSQKSAKVLWLCFTAWASSPVPNSVMVSPVEGQPYLQCSTVISSWFLLAFDVLFLKQVLYIFSTWCGLRSRWPESWEKWNTQKLCLMYIYNASVILSVSSLSIACIWCTVPATSTVFNTYSDVAWD